MFKVEGGGLLSVHPFQSEPSLLFSGVQLAPEGDGGGDDPLFPPDLFTKEQRQDGAVVLHAMTGSVVWQRPTALS